MAQNSLEWGAALCRALGFDPDLVSSICLELDASKPATVTLKLFPDKSDAVVAVLQEAGKHVEHIKVIDNLRPRRWDAIADLPGGDPDAL